MNIHTTHNHSQPGSSGVPAPKPSPAHPPAKSGVVRLRVRYSECDPMNVAHHASYAPWLEIGRTELLRDCGVTYKEMEAAGTFLVIVKLEIRYRAPVRYDDVVEVRTLWKGGGRVKILHEYEIMIAERDGAASGIGAAAASTTLACVDAHGKIIELPEWLRAG